MSEEELYGPIFSALKHPIRRKILRILNRGEANYSELLEALGVESGHLNYHLKAMEPLLKKSGEGAYGLSEYGRIALRTMREAEEPTGTRREVLKGFPSVKVVLPIGFLVFCLAVLFAYEFGAISDLRFQIEMLSEEISSLRSEVSELWFYMNAITKFSISGNLGLADVHVLQLTPSMWSNESAMLLDYSNCSLEAEVLQVSSYLLEVRGSDLTLVASIGPIGGLPSDSTMFAAVIGGEYFTENLLFKRFRERETLALELPAPGDYILIVGCMAHVSLSNFSYRSLQIEVGVSGVRWSLHRATPFAREIEYVIVREPNVTRGIAFPITTFEDIIVHSLGLKEANLSVYSDSLPATISGWPKFGPDSPFVSIVPPFLQYDIDIEVTRDGLAVPFRVSSSPIAPSRSTYWTELQTAAWVLVWYDANASMDFDPPTLIRSSADILEIDHLIEIEFGVEDVRVRFKDQETSIPVEKAQMGTACETLFVEGHSVIVKVAIADVDVGALYSPRKPQLNGKELDEVLAFAHSDPRFQVLWDHGLRVLESHAMYARAAFELFPRDVTGAHLEMGYEEGVGYDVDVDVDLNRTLKRVARPAEAPKGFQQDQLASLAENGTIYFHIISEKGLAPPYHSFSLVMEHQYPVARPVTDVPGVTVTQEMRQGVVEALQGDQLMSAFLDKGYQVMDIRVLEGLHDPSVLDISVRLEKDGLTVEVLMLNYRISNVYIDIP